MISYKKSFDTKVVFGWGKKMIFAKNVFPNKLDFHVTFSIVWYKIYYFPWKIGKCQLHCLNGKTYLLNGRSWDKCWSNEVSIQAVEIILELKNMNWIVNCWKLSIELSKRRKILTKWRNVVLKIWIWAYFNLCYLMIKLQFELLTLF